jgi:hypothetical protein
MGQFTASDIIRKSYLSLPVRESDDFECTKLYQPIEGMLTMSAANLWEGENIVFYVKDGYSPTEGLLWTMPITPSLIGAEGKTQGAARYSADTKIADGIGNSVCGDTDAHLSRRLRELQRRNPADLRPYMVLNIDTAKTVEIVNFMKSHAK